MLRLRSLSLPGAAALVLAASCSTPSTSSPPLADPDPQPTTPTHPQTGAELAAVALGVTIDARDDHGAPRLVRAVVPRASSFKGMTADQAARDHLAALKPLWLSHQGAADLTASGVQKLRNGASIVRFQQQVDGIDVYQSELRVMVQPDGALSAVSGTVRANAGRSNFSSTAVSAVERALDTLYGKPRARPAITQSGEAAGYSVMTVASNSGFRVTSARVKRALVPQGNRVDPVWVVELVSEKSGFDDKLESSARRFLINDTDGSTLRNINLTANDSFVYRALAEATGNRTPLDGALASFAPHPTGVPDGSLPDLGPYNLVVQEAFNGPHDPWLGTMATTTTGNNVDAYADIARPTGFSAGDIRPDVRGGRTLNHKYDFTAEPLATATQSKAAAVNVFFVTNWLHDWYYDSGFTEATGNAQLDNFDRGGVGGDPLVAHAQADALGGSRDNANMSTPEDGVSPTMNMFLWSGSATTSLVAGATAPATDIFVNGPRNFDLTGTVVLAQDTTGGGHGACVPIQPADGKIVLFEFDNVFCGSVTAVDNAKAAGAIGVIGMISVPGLPTQSLNGSAAANIPGLVIGFDDGVALEAVLPTSVSLHRETTLEHDGDFDNAIIAHEWGHYLHHRLASCDLTNQCAAMSEGWGDFNALLMMLRPTDNRDGTFAPGLYALTAGGLTTSGFLDPGYFGIRRFPYSTNRAKNGLSLRHIGDDNALPDGPNNPGPVANGNSEVHNAGEVWAESLWEVYNVLIDEHGVVEAHRRMSDYVVAGLLLTPPEATYTEGRDALLAAASALDSDDMLLMAAAFAGRGSGTCAVAPDRESLDFTGVVESGTIAARLETSAATLTDDGVSCDHDGYLDPGESGTLHLTIANSGIIAAENVVVRATTTSTGVTIGKAVNVSVIAAQTNLDIAIPVKIALTAPFNSNLDIAITIDGDAGCNTRHLALALHQRLGVDEAAAIATTDSIETRLLAWTPTGPSASALWGRVEGVAGNHVLFGTDAKFTTDTQLVSPVLQASPTAPLVVTVDHAFDLEAFAPFGFFFDGGVVEVTNDGGATWRDVTEVGVDPMYPASISTDFDNPLAGRDAFSGTNPAFPSREPLVLNFGTQFAGQAVQIRFRIGTDFCCAAEGWELDDVRVTGITNTPFPGFVPETTRCTTGTVGRDSDDSGVIAVRHAVRTSLAGVRGASE